MKTYKFFEVYHKNAKDLKLKTTQIGIERLF